MQDYKVSFRSALLKTNVLPQVEIKGCFYCEFIHPPTARVTPGTGAKGKFAALPQFCLISEVVLMLLRGL